MLDDDRLRGAIEGLVGFDWETADLDEVALLASRLGWEELEVDEVMASGGEVGEDGWVAAGIDDDETVFELLVHVHLWDVEDDGEPAALAAELEAAFDRTLAACVAVFGAPGHVEARPGTLLGVPISGRIACWRAGDGVVCVYQGVRDEEFGAEVALYAEGADDDDRWPGLEFLAT